MPNDTMPIVCGGTHYFIQHFLFPPAELSIERPSEQQQSNHDPLAIRWTPPQRRPPIPNDLDPELVGLLDTFWTPEPRYPRTTDDETIGAGPSTRPTSRPVATEAHQLLSIWRVLEAVDPKEAARWHWRDGRKVRRGLERWWERGGGEVSSVKGTEENKCGGRKAR